MNRSRMLTLAVVALILSVGVTYLTYRVLSARLQPPEETTQIVVAAEKLALGSRLTEKDVRLSPWPKGTPLEGSFQDPKAVVDRAILVNLLPNEPILESKLLPKEAGAGLVAVIPEGMRAVAIQVNDVIGVAGFVIPGTKVDLILTGTPPEAMQGGKGDEMATKIILENLQVLAAGQNVQQDVNGKPQTVQVVTLLVDPEQAQKIALATGDGRIQLALRNPIDKEQVDPPMIRKSALYAETIAEAPPKPQPVVRRAAAPRRPPPVVEAPPPPAPPRVIEVEVIQGSKRATETFEKTKP